MNSAKKSIKLSIILGFLIITILAACSTTFLKFPTPTPTTTPTLSELDQLSTGMAILDAMSTANPDGHLHEIMDQQGASLTAKQVQYDMVNNLDKKFGLSGEAEICDYYNWGYDSSIEDTYFCVQVTPSGGYLESWYIYFNRAGADKLYQDLLQGNVQIFLIAKVQSNRYEKGQDNMATGLYVEWYK